MNRKVTCCVPGCNNASHIQRGIGYHSIPLDKDRSSLWLMMIERCDLADKPNLHKGYVVCSDHFHPLMMNGCKLTKFALPTIGVRGHLKKIVTADVAIQHNVLQIDKVAQTNRPLPFNQSTQTNFDENSDYMAEDTQTTNKDSPDTTLLNNESENKSTFKPVLKPSNTKFGDEFRVFALNLFISNMDQYDYLRNRYCLPSVNLLKQNLVPIKTKIEEAFIRNLELISEQNVKKGDNKCMMNVHIIPVKHRLFYDITKDTVIGFEEINGKQNLKISDACVIVTITSVLTDWCHCIGYAFIKLTESDIIPWIQFLVSLLLGINLEICGIVFDIEILNSPINCQHFKTSQIQCDNSQIDILFNYLSLVRFLRDSLKSNWMIYYADTYANWEDLKTVFLNLSSNKCDLNKKHFELHGIDVINTKYAIDIFEDSVIETYVSSRNGKCDGTLFFLKQVNAMISLYKNDSLFGLSEETQLVIDRCVKFLSSFHGMQTSNNMFTDDYTEVNEKIDILHDWISHAFQVTVFNLRKIKRHVDSSLYVATKSKALTIDSFRDNTIDVLLEFAKKGSRINARITCLWIKRNIKKICEKIHAPTFANIKPSRSIDELLMLIQRYENSSLNIWQTVKKSKCNLSIETTDYRFEMPSKNKLAYVAAYIFHKCLEVHSCPTMTEVNSSSRLLHKIYPHFIAYNVLSPFFGLLKWPSDKSFVNLIEYLENTYEKFFNDLVSLENFGVKMFTLIVENQDELETPCGCFPIAYCIKLFIRIKIFNTMKMFRENLKRNGVEPITSFQLCEDDNPCFTDVFNF